MKRGTENGFTLVTIVFVMLALSSVGMGLTSTISNRAVASVDDLQGQQAFYTAEAALQYVLANEFMPDTDFSDNTPPSVSIDGSTVTVSYLSQSTYNATVRVSAQVGNSTRTVQQEVSHAIALGTPIFSGGNIDIFGNQPCILFGLICLPSGYMNGDLGAGGTITHEDHFIVNGNETEYMQVVVPEINVAELDPIISPTQHSGNLTIGPGIYNDDVHATGDVLIADNTIVNGSVISDGNISLGGDVAVFGTLAAEGDINGSLAENSILWAQDGPNGETLPVMMAGGNIDLQAAGLGTAVVGLVMAGGQIDFHSDVDPSEIWGEAIILSGATIATGNLNIYNEQGFVLILGDDGLIQAVAEAGNIKLENWREL